MFSGSYFFTPLPTSTLLWGSGSDARSRCGWDAFKAPSLSLFLLVKALFARDARLQSRRRIWSSFAKSFQNKATSKMCNKDCTNIRYVHQFSLIPNLNCTEFKHSWYLLLLIVRSICKGDFDNYWFTSDRILPGLHTHKRVKMIVKITENSDLTKKRPLMYTSNYIPKQLERLSVLDSSVEVWSGHDRHISCASCSW